MLGQPRYHKRLALFYSCLQANDALASVGSRRRMSRGCTLLLLGATAARDEAPRVLDVHVTMSPDAISSSRAHIPHDPRYCIDPPPFGDQCTMHAKDALGACAVLATCVGLVCPDPAPYRRGVPHKRIRGPICHALCRSRRVVRRAINLGTRRPGARPPRRRRAKPRDVQAGGLRAHSGLKVGRRRSGPGPPAARRDAPAVPAPRLPPRRRKRVVGARTATARARREGRPAAPRRRRDQRRVR